MQHESTRRIRRLRQRRRLSPRIRTPLQRLTYPLPRPFRRAFTHQKNSFSESHLLKTSNRILLSFGFLPAVWFLLFVSIAGSLVPRYSSVAQQASELTLVAGAPRSLVDVAALGVGLFLAIFAVGLWRASSRPIAFGALAWALFGLSMASNGIWIMGSPMHGAYGLGLIVMVAPALAALETIGLAADDSIYWITGVVSFLGIVYFWLNTLGYDPALYRGLTQRIYACLTLLWPAWAAYRLLYGTTSSRPTHDDQIQLSAVPPA